MIQRFFVSSELNQLKELVVFVVFVVLFFAFSIPAPVKGGIR